MPAPPDASSERAASPKAAPTSQEKIHAANFKSDVLEFQALTLRRLYFLAFDTGRTVAHLEFGVCG